MKRLLLLAALLGTSSMLPGCPIYADDDDCRNDSQCAPGYACDESTGDCRSTARTQCDQPSDCDGNQTCGRAGRCRAGDCTFEEIGCVSGYVCAAPDGVWRCVTESGGAGGATGEGGSAGSDGGAGAVSGAGAPSGGADDGASGSGAAGVAGSI